MKYSAVTNASSLSGVGVQQKRNQASGGLLAELRQMSRVSVRENGLLNHAQAAVVLDISSRRVAELVELGRLTRHDFLGRTYVSVREVVERREAEVKAGRPARSIGQRIRAAAKVVSSYDALNATVDAITPEPKKRKQKRK